MGLPNQLIAREIAKFVSPQAGGDVAPVAVVNPDGSNIGGTAGLTSLASGQFIGIAANSSLPSINGLVGLTGVVSLASGQYIGIGTNSSLPSITGLIQVNNVASLASIYGQVFVNNVASLASIYGQVQVVNGVTSLASGQFIGLNGVLSLASGQTIFTKEQNLISLASGQYIGIATNSSLPSITGLVQVNNVASLASVYGVVSLQPNTNSGWSKYSFLSLATGTQMVKTSAGELGGWYVGNPNAAIAYVSVFDQASGSASLGARVPDLIMTVPANGAANMEAANGINFLTAIQIAASMTPLGGSGPSIGLPVSIWYK